MPPSRNFWNPAADASILYLPTGKARIRYWPTSSVRVDCLRFVSRFVGVTTTPGSTPEPASVTAPRIEPVTSAFNVRLNGRLKKARRAKMIDFEFLDFIIPIPSAETVHHTPGPGSTKVNPCAAERRGGRAISS